MNISKAAKGMGSAPKPTLEGDVLLLDPKTKFLSLTHPSVENFRSSWRDHRPYWIAATDFVAVGFERRQFGKRGRGIVSNLDINRGGCHGRQHRS